MHFPSCIRPSRPAMLTEGLTKSEEEIIGEHFSYLKEATELGVVILAGRTLTSESFGIVIFSPANEAEARMFMESDPAVRAGVMLAELFPFGLALTSHRTSSP